MQDRSWSCLISYSEGIMQNRIQVSWLTFRFELVIYLYNHGGKHEKNANNDACIIDGFHY